MTDTPLERLAEAVKLRDALNVGQVLLSVADVREVLSELTTLREEKERLREALKPFAGFVEHFVDWAEDDTVHLAANSGTLQDGCWLAVWDFRRAASALEGEKT